MRRYWMLLLLSLVAAGTATAAAPTAPSAYEVEVIVFENRLPDLDGNEQWGAGPVTAQEATDAIVIGGTPTGSDLASVAAALQSDPRYRLLSHRRWVQTADNRPASSPVLLRTENREIDGYVRFYMSRFLHVEVNLAFQPQAAALGGVDPAPTPYRLSEQRRVRSQELHYFDHPKFGALVRVIPATAAALGSDR
ncbi:MAG: CsiV family protein [Gammaproteobacteria bacterium]